MLTIIPTNDVPTYQMENIGEHWLKIIFAIKKIIFFLWKKNWSHV